ncbi:MAG: 2-dehydro-3-deoxygalactonokinase [Betaproteobacteria bacterium]
MSLMEQPLIAVDWGSSSLRAVLMDRQGEILQRRQFEQGVLQVPPGRFEQVFEQHLGDWLADSQALCLISGMAGSRQGWREAPYCPCPAGFADLIPRLLWLRPKLALVPGLHATYLCPEGQTAAGQDDVMRGEEIQIFGALALAGLSQAELILPGTHSKWVAVREGRVQRFHTFMTGELYALLSQHSILARTLTPTSELDEPVFLAAVRLAQQGPGLLAHVFGTRTSALFERLRPEQQASHLSGLLIGEELRAITTHCSASSPLLLVGSAHLTQRYRLALGHLGRACSAIHEEATWAGHLALARSLANPESSA